MEGFENVFGLIIEDFTSLPFFYRISRLGFDDLPIIPSRYLGNCRVIISQSGSILFNAAFLDGQYMHVQSTLIDHYFSQRTLKLQTF